MESSKTIPTFLRVEAKPYVYGFPPRHTALLVIDMQRDFLLPNGFGEIQGGTLDAVQASIAPVKKLLETCRQANLTIFHTREGNKPDLSDCPSSKIIRQNAAPDNTQHLKVIGDTGQMGRLLIRGEYGHDIVDELQPLPNETVIDKPGKGAFWQTTLMDKLKAKAITHLIICGVTTECCFATTLREANDRGFECCGIEEATAGYKDDFKCPTLDMIHWSQGLFGFIASLQPLVDTLLPYTRLPASIGSGTPPQTPPTFDGDLKINSLQDAFRNGLSPVTVLESTFERIEKYRATDAAVWIHLESKESVMQRIRELLSKWPDPNRLPPLFGVPFSVKDSIDVAGIPTTTACPPLAHVPSRSSPVYDQILAQGAIFIGKTNLDQLATGLTGCRSPYGIPRSVFNHEFISGGSSSGNCVSVGAGLASFSLATDTAGSGRVPAGFNGVVGYKPTRGLVSAQGVTPACLSLDCVAIIARNVQDARTIWDLCAEFDEEDRYAKCAAPIQRHVNATGPQAKSFRFGTPPPEALALCNPIYRRMFNEAVQGLQAMGGHLAHIDWSPFEKAGKLLYEGTFVSERLASLPDNWLEQNRAHLHPVIREIFEKVVDRQSTAIEAYRDLQAKALYTRQSEKVFAYSSSGVDVVVVPTAPTHWTVEEVLADPIAKNSVLGEFTHFGNVLDLCAVAVPAGTYPVSEMLDEANAKGTLPFSVTLLGGSRMDAETLELARRFEEYVKGS
ncbi:allophanate hydrolase, partial [Lecanoromycetidae sp. Uapishka_2]